MSLGPSVAGLPWLVDSNAMSRQVVEAIEAASINLKEVLVNYCIATPTSAHVVPASDHSDLHMFNVRSAALHRQHCEYGLA